MTLPEKGTTEDKGKGKQPMGQGAPPADSRSSGDDMTDEEFQKLFDEFIEYEEEVDEGKGKQPMGQGAPKV